MLLRGRWWAIFVVLFSSALVIAADDDAAARSPRATPAASNTPVATVTAAPVASPSVPASAEPRVGTEVPVVTAVPSASVPAAVATVVPVVVASPSTAPTATTSVAPTVHAATPAPSSAPTACPADWFCYPRVGVSGPIVPYSDCSGSSDIGTSIRAFACLSPRYLMGHAYTQMGRIVGWQAGDVVYAYGQMFTITGALTAKSCEPPPLPLAPLSMQTSLSPSGCGSVLIVQAR